MINRELFVNREEQFQARLIENAVDLWIIEEPVHLYYFTGLSLSVGLLLISQKSSILFLDSRYWEMGSGDSFHVLSLFSEKNVHSWIEQSFPQDEICWSLSERKSLLCSYRKWQSRWKKSRYHATYVGNDSLEKQLLYKDAEERRRLEEAATLNERGMRFALSLLKEGIMEREIAFALEFFWKREAEVNLSFPLHIAFGENSSRPHHKAGSRKLQRDQIVLLDMGVCLRGYHSDMTRTFFWGSISSKFEEVYEVVLLAQEEAIAACHLGRPLYELDKIAREIIVKKGFGEYYVHALGHGIGLEIHESPTIHADKRENLLIQPGLAFTIEPGIYIPKWGGVRIEDTLFITESGVNNLCPFSKHPIIEKM